MGRQGMGRAWRGSLVGLALLGLGCAGDRPAFRDCGNGVLDAGETCDDGNRVDDDDCLSTCVPAVCGDGFAATFGVEAREECDGVFFGAICAGATSRPCRNDVDCGSGDLCVVPSCANLGFGGGPIACNPSCLRDTSSCQPLPTLTPTPTAGGPTQTPTRRSTRVPTRTPVT